jgi:hypothetical protein
MLCIEDDILEWQGDWRWYDGMTFALFAMEILKM